MTEYHILNLGAGVQSTTLYLMFMQGFITPQIDCAIFADTGEEPEAVYKHLAWLQSLKGPEILIRAKGKLGDDLISGKASRGNTQFMDIPVFTTHAGRPGIAKRQCSANYKIRVIEQAIRRDILGLAPGRSPRGVKIHQYIGISLDECGRARRIQQAKRQRYLIVHFPLIDLFMTRTNCVTWLHPRVPHKTPRIACVFCPFHSDHEWAELKEDPSAWSRILEVQAGIRKNDPTVFLHPSCQPIEIVQLDTRPNPLKAQLAINFAAECMGVCGV